MLSVAARIGPTRSIRNDDDPVSTKKGAADWILPLSLCAGGVVADLVGDGLAKPTYPKEPALGMLLQYNQALRERLDLPAAPDDDSDPRKPLKKLSWLFQGAAPFASADSAGLAGVWTF